MWPFDRGSGSDDTPQMRRELKKITWDEEVKHRYTIENLRLVWSGGAEQEIEYCQEKSPYYNQYLDIDGEPVLEKHEEPAYTQTLGFETEVRVETKRREAWITGDVPEWAEDTGDRREMVEVDDD